MSAAGPSTSVFVSKGFSARMGKRVQREIEFDSPRPIAG